MCCALPSVFLNWLSALYTQNHEHLQSGGISQTALCMPQAGGSCKMLQDSMGMPSVERFEDADFQSLARRNLESAAECAICLANVEVGRTGLYCVSREMCSTGIECRRLFSCLVLRGTLFTMTAPESGFRAM